MSREAHFADVAHATSVPNSCRIAYELRLEISPSRLDDPGRMDSYNAGVRIRWSKVDLVGLRLTSARTPRPSTNTD